MFNQKKSFIWLKKILLEENEKRKGQVLLATKGWFLSWKGKVEFTAVRSIQSNLCYSKG